MGKLTDLAVKHAGPGKHSDGENLYLVVKPTGTRSWQFWFRRSGRRREMGLGSYPTVKLADARRAALGARVVLAQGGDPLNERNAAAKARAGVGVTFDKFARECLAEWGYKWAPKTLDGWTRSLLDYSAKLGRLPLDTVTTEDVISVLKADDLWTAHPESAMKTRGRIMKVLDAAKVRGLRGGENPARWGGHLEHYLAPSDKEVQHHRALSGEKVGAFYRDLRGRDSVTAQALAFVILTASRPGEVRAARWDEIDLKNEVWTVPAERMKARREHRVPLSAEAVWVLKRARKAFGGDGLVFPGEKLGKPLSDAAMGKLLKVMGVAEEATAHGFRSTFKDWSLEKTTYPREVTEAALAHVVRDKTERAYARTDLFVKRRQLMADWAVFLSRKA